MRTILVLALLGGLACRGRSHAPDASPAPDEPFRWRGNENEALEDARRLGRGLVVFFFAEHCIPCKQLEAEHFANPEVRAALAKKWIPLRLDVTPSLQRELDLQKHWRVKTLPVVIIADQDGAEVTRFEQPLPTVDQLLLSLR